MIITVNKFANLPVFQTYMGLRKFLKFFFDQENRK